MKAEKVYFDRPKGGENGTHSDLRIRAAADGTDLGSCASAFHSVGTDGRRDIGLEKIHGVYGYQKISRAGNPAQ